MLGCCTEEYQTKCRRTFIEHFGNIHRIIQRQLNFPNFLQSISKAASDGTSLSRKGTDRIGDEIVGIFLGGFHGIIWICHGIFYAYFQIFGYPSEFCGDFGYLSNGKSARNGDSLLGICLFLGDSLTKLICKPHEPSGTHTKNYGKSSFLMDNSTISMATFNSKLLVITRGYLTKKNMFFFGGT